MILVERFYARNELRNYSYLLINKESREAWAIDPYDAMEIAHYIKKNDLVLKAILNTHQHYDHIRGNEQLTKLFQTNVLSYPNINGESFSFVDQLNLSPTSLLKVFFSPGHTLDHVVFILSENGTDRALFSGDTLFNSGVGNCKGGGNIESLYETIQAIKKLPLNILIYPGHDYRLNNLSFAISLLPENQLIKTKHKEIESRATEHLPPSTLEEEMKVNIFLMTQLEEVRQKIISHKVLKHDSDKDVFKMIRSLRDHW